MIACLIKSVVNRAEWFNISRSRGLVPNRRTEPLLFTADGWAGRDLRLANGALRLIGLLRTSSDSSDTDESGLSSVVAVGLGRLLAGVGVLLGFLPVGLLVSATEAALAADPSSLVIELAMRGVAVSLCLISFVPSLMEFGPAGFVAGFFSSLVLFRLCSFISRVAGPLLLVRELEIGLTGFARAAAVRPEGLLLVMFLPLVTLGRETTVSTAVPLGLLSVMGTETIGVGLVNFLPPAATVAGLGLIIGAVPLLLAAVVEISFTPLEGGRGASVTDLT